MPPMRAAQYVRMSTEGQDFSVAAQMAVNAAYALERGMEIVRTYRDEGISGVGIEKREGLKTLLADVLAGEAGFEGVIVYDISRWGRFQDPDESAHYEFLCRQAGVAIHYSAEGFAAHDSLLGSLAKSLKRVMAAEYSRELSAKVSRAQAGLAAKGYWICGAPGYGFRRRLVRADGSLGRVLEAGDRKGPQNGRTILVPGPPEEVAVVRRIYSLYLDDKYGYRRIAGALNNDGVTHLGGKPWTIQTVRDVLINPKYAGANVTNKERKRLGEPNRKLPSSEWRIVEGAFEPLIEKRRFEQVQRRRAARTRLSDEQLLDGLRRIERRRGSICRTAVDADAGVPSSNVYIRRFGSLMEAYRLAGYTPTWRHINGSEVLKGNRLRRISRNRVAALGPESVLIELRRILAEHGSLTKELIDLALGSRAYDVAAAYFGSGRRMYALAGYRPTARQNLTFDRSGSEVMTEAEAETLRLRVLAGAPVVLSFVETLRSRAETSPDRTRSAHR